MDWARQRKWQRSFQWCICAVLTITCCGHVRWCHFYNSLQPHVMVSLQCYKKLSNRTIVQTVMHMARGKASWSIKVSITAQKFATSTLIPVPLKLVSIKCIEHDATCLKEGAFIKLPFTDQLQPIYFTGMPCRLCLLVLNTSLAKCEASMLCNPMNASLNQRC